MEDPAKRPESGWQFAFPASPRNRWPKPSAAPASPSRPLLNTLRYSFATELIRDGYDIRTVQELLGNTDVQTTMIYTHVLNRGGRGSEVPRMNCDGGGM